MNCQNPANEKIMNFWDELMSNHEFCTGDIFGQLRDCYWLAVVLLMSSYVEPDVTFSGCAVGGIDAELMYR